MLSRHLEVKLFFACVLLSALLNSLSLGQDMTSASFHVDTVRTEPAKDWCTTGECSAKRIVVEGYVGGGKDEVAMVHYVLDCVEVVSNRPTPHFLTACVHVHARETHAVKIGETFISFSDVKQKSQPEPALAPYEIVSESRVGP